MNRHDHDDRLRLTIGCDACIERVKIDQAVAALDEWLQATEPFEDFWTEPVDLPTLAPTPHRRYQAYRALRSFGYDVHDVRYALASWQIETTPLGALLA